VAQVTTAEVVVTELTLTLEMIGPDVFLRRTKAPNSLLVWTGRYGTLPAGTLIVVEFMGIVTVVLT
jgi:hypothetical protein